MFQQGKYCKQLHLEMNNIQQYNQYRTRNLLMNKFQQGMLGKRSNLRQKIDLLDIDSIDLILKMYLQGILYNLKLLLKNKFQQDMKYIYLILVMNMYLLHNNNK